MISCFLLVYLLVYVDVMCMTVPRGTKTVFINFYCKFTIRSNCSLADCINYKNNDMLVPEIRRIEL